MDTTGFQFGNEYESQLGEFARTEIRTENSKHRSGASAPDAGSLTRIKAAFSTWRKPFEPDPARTGVGKRRNDQYPFINWEAVAICRGFSVQSPDRSEEPIFSAYPVQTFYI